MWRLALSGRESRLLELYLARYPAGAHAREAQALLTSLKDAESAADDPGLVCERLATHPHDETASTPGVELPALRADAAAAIGVCAQAAAAHPEIAHYTALLARAEAAAGRMDDAYAHYRKAADAGDARAMYSLGLMLETGDHAPKDLKAAYALYEKAADRGLADGAINLAVALAEGKGVDKNLPRAYALLTTGVAGGFGARDLRPRRIRRTRLRRQDDGRARSLSARRGVRLRQGPSHRRRAARRRARRRGEGSRTRRPTNCSAPSPPISASSIADLTGKTQNWSPATVKALESRLAAAGYYSGPINGKSGPALGPALRQWRLLGAPEKS